MRIRPLVSRPLALLIGAWVAASGLRAQAPPARWTPELAFTVKRVAGVAISPDGRWAAVELSEPVMETEGSEWRTSVHVFPIGPARPHAYRFARLYSLDLWAGAGRAGRPLTPPHLQVGGHRGAGLSGAAFDWSPDGSAIAFSHSPSPFGDDWVRADVSVVDVATGRVRPLAATPVAEGGAAWAPDGRWIAVTASAAPATHVRACGAVRVCERARAVRAAPGGGAAIASRHAVRNDGGDAVALVRRPRDRGSPDLPGRLPAGVARAAADDPARRPTLELHADVHRQCERVPDRRLRFRRLRGAPPQRPRELWLWPRVPLRKPA